MAKQIQTVNPQDMDIMLQTQCDCFTQKISKIADLDTAAVDMLTDVVNGGVWSAAQKSKLIVNLSNALTIQHHRSSGSAGTAQQQRRPNQEIRGFQNWCIQAEAEIFKSESIAFTVKSKTAVCMMARMGLILASERSKGHIMHVLLAACPTFLNSLSYDDVRRCYLDFTRDVALKFKGVRDAGPMGYITDYPLTPESLHPSQVEAIFKGEPPVQLVIDDVHMQTAVNAVIQRGHSKKLKENQHHNLQAQQGTEVACANPAMQLANCMVQMIQQSAAHRDAGLPIRMNCLTGPNGHQLQLLDVSRGNQPNLQRAASFDGILAGARGPLLSLEDRATRSGELAVGENQLSLTAPGLSTERAAFQGLSPQPRAPANSPGTSSDSQSPAEQAERFMMAMKGELPDDADDDDDADAGTKTAGKAKAKATAKAKAKAKAKANADAKCTAKAKPKPTVGKTKDLIFKPKVALEQTRSQWLFRPGLPFSECGEGSRVFKFHEHGSKAAAKKAADSHLKKFKSTHTCV